MHTSELDLAQINRDLHDKDPEAILSWALSLQKKTIMTTSFGYNSALSLYLLSQVDVSVPVVWVDSGYNVKDAYLVAEGLMQTLQLNMHVYNPLMSAERRNAIMGGIPAFDDPLFEEFTRQVKLEPFMRSLDELKPEIWISGIRQEETEHRRNLDIVTRTPRGILKVAPLFYWTQEQVEKCMKEHNLPSCKHYFDPTKVHEHRECGLHTNS